MILASRSSRLFAQVLDSVIGFLPLIGLIFLSELAPGGIGRSIENLFLPAVLVVFAYILFADSLPGGQSYGKRVLGIAVVDRRNGAPCSPWQSFVRNVLLSIFGLLDWIFIFGDERQRLGDMAARTIVVEAETVGAGTRYGGQESPRAVEQVRPGF